MALGLGYYLILFVIGLLVILMSVYHDQVRSAHLPSGSDYGTNGAEVRCRS